MTSSSSQAENSSADLFIIIPVLFLAGLGLIMVYSSSAVYAERLVGNPSHFMVHQGVHFLLGLVALCVVYRLPSEFMRKKVGWFFLIAVFLCLMVLIPGVGVVRGGARRWLDFGIAAFQPSEVAKLALVILLAAMMARRDKQAPAARVSLVLPLLVAQVVVVLLLMEPDLGTALVVELIVGVMIFVGGVRLRALAVMALMASPVFYHLVVGTPWRLRRLLGYIDPWAYRETVGYQVTEAMISMGSGGPFGLGVGEGKHGLFFLPEAHTDFVFAIVGQELGFLGVFLVILAFSVLVGRALYLALSVDSNFQRYLAVGIAAAIGLPALFNTAVVMGLLPTKGLPLPFVSYGGSHIVASFVLVGLLLRISADLGSAHRRDTPGYAGVGVAL